MDIYRFFHPHHNPRLLSTPVRQQELSELEQAASELRKALERITLRLSKKPVAPIMPEHFTDIVKAITFVEKSLQTLSDAHPGDSDIDIKNMVQERAEFSGWETWSSFLTEQLKSSNPLISPHSDIDDSDDNDDDLLMKKTG